MNRSLLLCFFLFLAAGTITAQVKIGSAGTPNGNAVLELDGGTNKGLLLPRLTNTQLTAMTAAPDGLIIYNNTDGFLYIRKNAAWQKITDATNTGSGEGFTLPYAGSSAAGSPAFWITNTGNADAVRGYASAGDGITGISTTGRGGYFSSSSGAALVTNTGNVGISTLSPAFPLDVNGRVRLRSNGATNSAGIWFDKIYTANVQSNFVGTFNDSTFGIYGGGNWKFFFDHTNNNFGINNSDPKAPLSFSNATGNKLDIYYGSANSRYGIGLQAGLMQLYSGSSSDDIAFGYGSSTSFTEHMRIKGNGNVGLGITTPGAKLDIRDVTIGYALYVSKTGTTEGIPVGISNNSAYATLYATNSGSGPSLITEGRVGINNTNPVYNLDVAGRMRIRNESAGFTAGIWLDGATLPLRGFVGMYSNDVVGMYGAGSGWGIAMNVNTNAVGINTVTPNSALQVVGSVSVPVRIVTAPGYTITDNDFSIRYEGTGGIITLPPAAGRTGRVYIISANFPLESGVNFKQLIIRDANSNNVLTGGIYHDPDGLRVSVNSYELFDVLLHTQFNNTEVSLAKKRKTSVTLQSDGSKWNIIDNDFQY